MFQVVVLGCLRIVLTDRDIRRFLAFLDPVLLHFEADLPLLAVFSAIPWRYCGLQDFDTAISPSTRHSNN